jgi:hypothetical protein
MPPHLGQKNFSGYIIFILLITSSHSPALAESGIEFYHYKAHKTKITSIIKKRFLTCNSKASGIVMDILLQIPVELTGIGSS